MLKEVFKLFIFLLLISCGHKTDYKSIHVEYDKNVIRHIPSYDSIRKLVISNIKSIDFKNRYVFTYVYNFDSHSQISGFSNESLPNSILMSVKNVFEQLGERNIYGFTISIDSCFEIYIRNNHIEKERIDVRQSLYWQKCHGGFQNNEINRDTLLSDGWTYRIWLDKRAD